MSSKRTARVILGRDGVYCGETCECESEFDAWATFVADRIDERTGLDVSVETRGRRDVQTNAVRVYDGDDEQTIRDALHALWDEFCDRLF